MDRFAYLCIKKVIVADFVLNQQSIIFQAVWNTKQNQSKDADFQLNSILLNPE